MVRLKRKQASPAACRRPKHSIASISDRRRTPHRTPNTARQSAAMQSNVDLEAQATTASLSVWLARQHWLARRAVAVRRRLMIILRQMRATLAWPMSSVKEAHFSRRVAFFL
ncbi:hypothetical protein BOTBODRAFT_39429 [Botryobasidium botryosum FD-172 SS1]|uniref:Uncharacterized protein n=1 Tax=Botryobasidium botryosum (strain FD-172 SS1) TaxID=930990 RepID=A0A067M4Z8_BOTB1|nr:hypothetical protein BOTBODRAFT_39429 [Botryobasidium botryosum FD-172 SS1]